MKKVLKCLGKRPKLQGTSESEKESSLGKMNGFGNTEEQHPCALIGDRLWKLEQLFERFVCRKSSNISTPPDVPLSRSSTMVESTPDEQPKMVFGILPEISTHSQSISDIGQGIVDWHTTIRPAAQHPWPSPYSSAPVTDSGAKTECERIRRSLIALLPSQHDSDLIFESTHGWTIFANMYKPNKDLFVHGDPLSYALDMAAVGRERSIIIARTLLHLAVCIRSLPPEFDTRRLSHARSLDETMETYVSSVNSFISTSDEVLCTLPGLETLLLLTIYHVKDSSLRMSWLVIRRAVNLAQLMGLHRIMKKSTSTCQSIEAIDNAKVLWRAIVDVETYLGLHLRLPFSSEVYPCDSSGDSFSNYRAKVAILSRQIAELDGNITPQTYVHALNLDEKLETLMKQMPQDFWEVPNVPSTARTPESAAVLERLVQQIWHLELKIFVHLPFLLRAHQESKYEYSKITGLQASRNVIMRWFALRNASITQACCRFAELGVFFATLTIGLNILIEMGTKEKSEVQRTRGSDFAIVCRVIGEMEKLAKGSPREKIAARSASVIKKVLCSLDPSQRTAQSAKLRIPYFGTIEIAYHKPPLRPPFDLDSDSGRKLNEPIASSHSPVFSFVSNDLWPSTERSECGDLDFDIILFDGLEDRDTEGNWVF